MTQELPQIYAANQATFPIRIRKITVQICHPESKYKNTLYFQEPILNDSILLHKIGQDFLDRQYIQPFYSSCVDCTISKFYLILTFVVQFSTYISIGLQSNTIIQQAKLYHNHNPRIPGITFDPGFGGFFEETARR